MEYNGIIKFKINSTAELTKILNGGIIEIVNDNIITAVRLAAD